MFLLKKQLLFPMVELVLFVNGSFNLPMMLLLVLLVSVVQFVSINIVHCLLSKVSFGLVDLIVYFEVNLML